MQLDSTLTVLQTSALVHELQNKQKQYVRDGPLPGASRLEGGSDAVGCVSSRTLDHADWLSRCPRHQRCTVAVKVTDAARP